MKHLNHRIFLRPVTLFLASLCLLACQENPAKLSASSDSAETATGASVALAPAPPLHDLGGSTWTHAGTPPAQLKLLASGQAQGFGGCNRFNGPWRAEGTSLRIGPLAATRMMCLGPAGDQETQFLQALEATRSARREGAELVLLGAQGQELMRLQSAN